MKENVAEANNDEKKQVVIRAELAANAESVASFGEANEGLTQEGCESCLTHAGQTSTAFYTWFTGSINGDKISLQNQL